MNYLQSFQQAICYIEDNLLNEITYKDVAKHLYVSKYHFHRTFTLITGMTANEYIRNRRLSLAADDLLNTKLRIIEISSKYCYDSPESFSRAFTRFHGVSPSKARNTMTSLKTFNRLQIKISIEGGLMMDYRIEKRGEFEILAIVRDFSNNILDDDRNMDIPNFWSECKTKKVFDELGISSKKLNVYGLCGPKSKNSNVFKYGIGVEYDGSGVPDGFEIWKVTPPTWAVFKCFGDSGKSIANTWSKIFSDFLPNSNYKLLDDVDFELYYNEQKDFFCEIWVPVEQSNC